jgi:hypothetical protein
MKLELGRQMYTKVGKLNTLRLLFLCNPDSVVVFLNFVCEAEPIFAPILYLYIFFVGKVALDVPTLTWSAIESLFINGITFFL